MKESYWDILRSQKNNALAKFKCDRGKEQVCIGKADDKTFEPAEVLFHCDPRLVENLNKKDENGDPIQDLVYDCERCRRLILWRNRYNEGMPRRKTLKLREDDFNAEYNEKRLKNKDADKTWAGIPEGAERKTPKIVYKGIPRTPRYRSNKEAYKIMIIEKKTMSRKEKGTDKKERGKSGKKNKK